MNIEGNNAIGAGISFVNARSVLPGNGNSNGNGRSNPGGLDTVSDFAVLTPGIYCKGLVIDGANVVLRPGVYHVWEDLVFTSNAGVYGDGVTFLLKGEKNRLLVDDGAQVWLRAPSTGVTKGLVFWQRYLRMRDYVRGTVPPIPDRRTATSEIKSGGGMTMIGTAYLPNHKLQITSDNSIASQSPATSFIAYQIEFRRRTNIQVAVDHVSAGLPPIQPYTDDGARVVY